MLTADADDWTYFEIPFDRMMLPATWSGLGPAVPKDQVTSLKIQTHGNRHDATGTWDYWIDNIHFVK